MKKLDAWRLERATKNAQKRFKKLSKLADRLRMGKGERRGILKRIIWGAGYKHVRMIEK